ncbi:MAG: N-acetylmuramoyl-L-alanine amidase [Lachnospiraceae bacterium]|nr:N-acetylmuramoyl-L-alanine amidase [Lachnospiraceae bacterium]
MKSIRKKFFTFLALSVAFILAFGMLAPLKAAHADTNDNISTFKYKDGATKKTVTYNGVIPTYIIDGEEADLSKQPALLSERGIAYASAGALFKDTIGAKVKYTASKKRISFKYKGHELIMYIGSTTAILDDEEIEAPCEPFRIKYKKSKKTATMVPSRFVAESLGMEYVWSSADSTVTIKTPFYYSAEGDEELKKYTGTRGKITYEGEAVDLKDTPSLIFNDTAMLSTRSRLIKTVGLDYSFDENSGVIKVGYGENSVLYCLNSRITYVNGLLNRCSYAPSIFYIFDRDDDILYIPGRFTFENLGFNYVWNSETGTSEISTFKEEEEISDTGEGNEGTDVIDDVDGTDSTDCTDTSENDNESGNVDGSDNTEESNTLGDTEGTGETDGSVNTENNDTESTDSVNSGENGEDEPEPTPVVLPLELINVYNTNDGYKFFIDKENCIQDLKLPVPESVRASDIEVFEDIIGCMTELTIAGDHRDFYKEAKVKNSGEAILQIQVYYDPNTDSTVLRLYSDLVLGCDITDIESGKVNVKMDFVKNLYKKVIVLDAGHGGHDPGAQAQGYNESDLNLKVILNAREMFKETDVKVFYTRVDDTFQTLYDRADFAELVGADLFISVHHNSSWYNTIKGTSVYYGDLDTYTSLNGLTSEKLANLMLNNLTENLDTEVFATGVIAKNFVVVRDSKAPAVLLEIGFMSCPEELERLVKDKFSRKVARTIVDTVLSIYKEAE